MHSHYICTWISTIRDVSFSFGSHHTLPFSSNRPTKSMPSIKIIFTSASESFLYITRYLVCICCESKFCVSRLDKSFFLSFSYLDSPSWFDRVLRVLQLILFFVLRARLQYHSCSFPFFLFIRLFFHLFYLSLSYIHHFLFYCFIFHHFLLYCFISLYVISISLFSSALHSWFSCSSLLFPPSSLWFLKP